MKNIYNVEIKNFKTIGELDMNISPNKLNVLFGMNGVGKSNILKAISSLNNTIDNPIPSLIRKRDKSEDESTTIKITNGITLDKVTFTENKGNQFKHRFIFLENILSKVNENNFSLKPITSNDPIFVPPDWLKNEENWNLPANEIDKRDEFIEDVFAKESKLKMEYIDNAENLNKFKYTYNIRNDFFEADENGDQKDMNLSMLLNFFSFIGVENVTNSFKKYLKNIDSVMDDADLDSEIESIETEINGKIEVFFEKHFKDCFDFKFGIKLKNEILSLKVENNKNYKFDRKTMEDASSGSRALFYILVRACHLIEINKETNNKLWLLFDEPEKNLYPILQMKLVDFFSEMIKNQNISIIYSSHHTAMIPKDDFTLNIVERGKDGETIIERIFGECNDDGCENIKDNVLVKEFINSAINHNKTFEEFIMESKKG